MAEAHRPATSEGLVGGRRERPPSARRDRPFTASRRPAAASAGTSRSGWMIAGPSQILYSLNDESDSVPLQSSLDAAIKLESEGRQSRPLSAQRSRPATASRSRPLTPLERRVEGAVVQELRSRPQTPRAPVHPAEGVDADVCSFPSVVSWWARAGPARSGGNEPVSVDTGSRPATAGTRLLDSAGGGGGFEHQRVQGLPSVVSWWVQGSPEAAASYAKQAPAAGAAPAVQGMVETLDVVDADGDGFVDEDEFRAYLAANRTVRYGARRVCISGLELRNNGTAKPYRGINGEYEVTEEVCNGRAVYSKVGRPTTAMWWANIDGKISWCVGPREQVGTEGMWAYVESMGFGPEEAGARPWMVYSYNSGAWEEQTGVEVLDLDPAPDDSAFGAGVEAALDARSSFALATPRMPKDPSDSAAMQRVLSWLPAVDAAESQEMLRAFSWLSVMSAAAAGGSSSLASWWADTALKSGAQMRPGMSWLRTRPLSAVEQRIEQALLTRVHQHTRTPRAPRAPADSPHWPFGVGLRVVADAQGVYRVSGVAPHSAAEACGQIQVLSLPCTL
jgi:hypothetical protein